MSIEALGGQRDPVFTFALGLVEHGIGLLNQGFGIPGVIGTDGNADTGCDRIEPDAVFIFPSVRASISFRIP